MDRSCLQSVLAVSLLTFFCQAEFRLGVENFDQKILNQLRPLKIGLIAHQASCDQKGNRTLDILLKHRLKVVAIGAPEHGFEGTVAAAKPVGDMKDAATGINILSLYAGGDKSKRINPQFLSKVDVIIFDLHDSGMRHYTYISTLLKALEACAQANKPIVVLDSPNPLGGIMEGPVADADILKLHSFIACAALPLRHGMTIGEIACFFNRFVLKKQACVQIVRMNEYDRYKGPFWFGKMLSPNIRFFAASQGYSFLGLIGEVKPMRMGLELGKPFQMVVLPDTIHLSRIKWQILSQKLETFGIRSLWYEGTDERERGYHGLLFRFGSVAQKPVFNAFLAIVEFMKKNGVLCTFAPFFDRAVGTKVVREYLNGRLSKEVFTKKINAGLKSFYAKAQPCFLYDPQPRLIIL